MRKTQKLIALAAVASLGLIATACGDDNDNATEDTTAAVTEETTAMTEDTTAMTEETTGEAAEVGTIVDIAAADENFSTLVSLVTTAELVETLSGEGPFTVFAPTNAAFEALAEKMGVTIDELSATLTEDTALLAKVLTTHVISGKVMAADTAALDGTEVEMVSGEKATVASADGAVSLTIGESVANVVTADIEASNGVIHVIDLPLLPLELQS
jgi:uncharacterized surface protein with fasciclin (FAS1) repeats